MTNQYIQSVIDLIKTGEQPGQVFKGLKHTLEKHGHSQLYARILAGVLRKLSASTYKELPEVVLAKAEDKSRYSAAIKEALTELGASGSELSVVEDKTITGGFVASYNHNSIDASYKSKLLNWYRETISK